jgi:hypothetical protein
VGLGLLVGALPVAWAYWTDYGAVSAGPVTTWTQTAPTCTVVKGNDQMLNWTTVPGTTYTITVALDPASAVPNGLSFWSATSTVKPGAPQTTTGGHSQWGISTANPIESAHFFGTWQMVATAPGGVWTSTKSGTWDIHYAAPPSASCAVNP